MSRRAGRTILAINIISELMSVAGNILTNFALLLAPVSMVFLVNSFQPALVFMLGAIGTKFYPHIIEEDLSRKKLFIKIFSLSLIILGSAVLFVLIP